MTQYTITDLEQLKDVEPDGTLSIFGLNLNEQEIKANAVYLYDCRGTYVSLAASQVFIDGGSRFYLINAAGARTIDLRDTSVERIVAKDPLECFAASKANVRTIELGDARFVSISRSWVDRLFSQSIEFVRLFEAYIGTAGSETGRPAIFARAAAVGHTSWPFVDGGTDTRGYRINVFRGAMDAASGEAVTGYGQLAGAEPAVVITAGCRTFTSAEKAANHWRLNRTGVLPAVRRAVKLLKEKEVHS